MRVELNQSMALVIDIQEKLFPHMNEKDLLLENCTKLIKGLQLLEIPFILNEQYPKGLGQTHNQIKKLLKNNEVFEKFTFSCCKTEKTKETIIKTEKKFIIVFGIETHVCVLQSVIDLLDMGFTPVVVSDCTSSRKANDAEVALRRMELSGAIITTYESLLFELCISAKNKIFKDISKLVR
ncbi:MAG: hydrolase [Epsilonproteobacteria bacterium]|nr:hydrolase [Campylobacterota bacterium]